MLERHEGTGLRNARREPRSVQQHEGEQSIRRRAAERRVICKEPGQPKVVEAPLNSIAAMAKSMIGAYSAKLAWPRIARASAS